VDDLARACRKNLQASLSITHCLTRNSKSPCDRLIHRMGAVLGAVVDANYGNTSHSLIANLYRTLDEMTARLIDNSSSIAFVHFARAFAVVLEESLQLLQQSRSCSSCSNIAQQQEQHPDPPTTLSPSAAVFTPRCETPVIDQISFPPSDTVSTPHHTPCTDERMCIQSAISSHPVDLLSLVIPVENSNKEAKHDAIIFDPSTATPVQQLQYLQQPRRRKNKGRKRSKAARRNRENDWPPPLGSHAPIDYDPKLDYSHEAIRDAVVIFGVPISVTATQLVHFLGRIGPVAELSWPIYTKDSNEYYAAAKYEDDAIATKAPAFLSGSRLDGVSVVVRPAKYWQTYDPKRVMFGKKRQEDEKESDNYGSIGFG
ncbi:hypothetical protein PFISCL1PPCAC_21338, partial [Pristionchus fissidentatus]